MCLGVLDPQANDAHCITKKSWPTLYCKLLYITCVKAYWIYSTVETAYQSIHHERSADTEFGNGFPCPATICKIEAISRTVVLMLDDNSEKGAHFRRNFCYLISLRYLIRSRAITKIRYSFSEKAHFPLCMRKIFLFTV